MSRKILPLIIIVGLFLLYCAWFGNKTLVALGMVAEVVPGKLTVPVAAATYTAEQLISIMASVVTLIGVLGGVAVQVITALRTGVKQDELKQQSKVIEKVLVGDGTVNNQGVVNQLKEVQVHTNSALATANTNLETLAAELKSKNELHAEQLKAQADQMKALHDAIRELKSERDKKEIVAGALAAVAAAQVAPTPAAPTPAAPTPAAPPINVVVEKVTTENLVTENLHTGVLTTGDKKEKD